MPLPRDLIATKVLVTVTYEDVHTLKDDWLTDNVIAFWEEYGLSLLRRV